MSTLSNLKKRKYKKLNKGHWISDKVSAVLQPPEHLTCSEWANKYRKLNEKTASTGGNWDTNTTPYLREIQDFISNSSARELVICKGSQLGGTEAILNMVGWQIAEAPSPIMIVYPTEQLAKSVAKNRLGTLNELSLFNLWDSENSEFLELQYFNNAILYLAWAGSASALSSKPCRCVFFDEVDKYPPMARGDANPIKLGEERTKTFSYKAKVVKLSTPTVETGHVWKAYQHCEQKKRYQVPCPYCGEYFVFDFNNIKWDSGWTFAEIADNAYYECPFCDKQIKTSDKEEMLLNGKWVADIEIENPLSIGYQISSIYSPFLRFGDVAVEFLQSKNDYTKLMNFVNGWLAEPFREEVSANKVTNFTHATTQYAKFQVPKWGKMLTVGADVQKDCIYYCIRAWGAKGYSSLIAEGSCSNFEEFDRILYSNFICPDTGQVFNGVNLCAIDSGYRTDEVYDFCAEHEDFVFPIKGDNDSLGVNTPYIINVIRRPAGKTKANGIRLYRVNTPLYKIQLHSRLSRGIEKSGSWNVYNGVSPVYESHIFSEVPERDLKTRKIKWVKTYGENHWLDCEVYNLVCAELMNIFNEEFAEEVIQEEEKESYIPHRNWFGGNNA